MEYKYTLEIHGMMCEHCEGHVNDVIRQNFDVKKVTSSHVKKETVILSKKPLDEDKIREVIAKTGYELLSIKMEEVPEKKGFFARLFNK